MRVRALAVAEVDQSARRKERERGEREREPERERARDHRERDAGDHDARQKLFEGRDSKARVHAPTRTATLLYFLMGLSPPLAAGEVRAGR
jgi:hypothetical protein